MIKNLKFIDLYFRSRLKMIFLRLIVGSSFNNFLYSQAEENGEEQTLITIHAEDAFLPSILSILAKRALLPITDVASTLTLRTGSPVILHSMYGTPLI